MDAAGVVGGGLRVASLYVYGPRAHSLPVLTTASVTPNADGLYGQSNPLFLTLLTGTPPAPVANTDPQLRTDATGFKYQLLPIPADMAPGTYMVRVRIGDYGRVGAGNYVIESLAFTNIQIGTATVEPKLSGDACVECHGTGYFSPHNERHAVVFNVDECLSCHDYSGNHADPISNRTHAIHGATGSGDLAGPNSDPPEPSTDWSHVTFPQRANNCTICHTNPDAETPVWESPDAVACAGCHGGDPTAAAFPLEAAAASHMVQNGGDFDPLTPPFPNTCLVCHGPGSLADLFITHKLITFQEPEEDE
jgi:hypothetical protein